MRYTSLEEIESPELRAAFEAYAASPTPTVAQIQQFNRWEYGTLLCCQEPHGITRLPENLKITKWYGDLIVAKEASIKVPDLQEVDGGVFILEKGNLQAPSLKTVRLDLYLHRGAILTSPDIEHVGHDISLSNDCTFYSHKQGSSTFPKLNFGGYLYISTSANLEASPSISADEPEPLPRPPLPEPVSHSINQNKVNSQSL